MSKPSGSGNNNHLILRRQLQELTRRPVEGFSAGLARSHPDHSELDVLMHYTGLTDDNNLLEWEVIIIGYVQRSPVFPYLPSPSIAWPFLLRLTFVYIIRPADTL